MALRYPYYLFDADGTLFDYDAGEYCALTAILREYALCETQEIPKWVKAYDTVNQAMWRQFERGEISQTTLRTERFRRWLPEGMDYAAVSVRYLEYLGQQSQMMPGALETISALAGTAPIAIVTNGITEVQTHRLAGSPLAPYIKALVISETVGRPKPHRDMFDVALSKIGGSVNNTLMVGDGQGTDIRGALAMGMHACFYNHKRERPVVQPTFAIQELTELL